MMILKRQNHRDRKLVSGCIELRMGVGTDCERSGGIFCKGLLERSFGSILEVDVMMVE